MVSHKCEKCGSSNLITGKLKTSDAGGHVCIVPKTCTRGIHRNTLKIHVTFCKDCGHVLGFEVKDLKNVDKHF
jgi:hypothetical protein